MFAVCNERVDSRRMGKRAADRDGRRTSSEDADAVLAACRVLVAISVASMNAIEEDVTPEQLRMLVVVSSRGVTTLSELAAATRMHMSKASRACDRMVGLGLLGRSDDPDDRRSLRLSLTEHGGQIVAAVAAARQDAVLPALRRLDPTRRADLVAVLIEFTEAAGEPAEADLWALGWAT